MKELEMILQAIQQLGAAGKEAFIWWLVVKHALSYILHFVAVCLLLYVVFKIARMIYESDSNTKTLAGIARILGAMNNYGGFSRSDVFERVVKLKGDTPASRE